MTIRETLRYRGSIGQWSWVMHRLTGLGVVFFLIIHVIDTSWAVFYPGLYEKAIAIYQTPLFTLGEFALVFAVVYHAFNGLRIALFDFKPEWWQYQKQAAYYVFAATAAVLVPVFIGMFVHVVDHYSQQPNILPLGDVLVEQIPFLAGMVVAGMAALVLAWVYEQVTGNREVGGSAKNSSRQMERFWWSFMRVSGILIVPLVFGHLAMMHVLQGVFDLTAAGYTVVGTTQIGSVFGGEYLADALARNSSVVFNGWNDTGTATEFVAERWNYLFAGVAIWKFYDIALLMLVTAHGFNGLRYVLTDYTMENPTLRRAAGYACVIGAVALLLTGGGALLGTIEPEAIALAQESLAALYGEG